MTPAAPRAIRDLIAPLPEGTQALVLAVRKLLLGAIPRVREMPDEKSRVIAYGYSPKYADIVATIILSRSGVKLGIVRGSELDDPDGILAGAGKVHRHIAFTAPDQVTRPAVRAMLQRALERRARV